MYYLYIEQFYFNLIFLLLNYFKLNEFPLDFFTFFLD
jgi:hypothetical protein